MNAQKEALVSKRPWKASILWTPSVITPLQSIHSANAWASAVESGAACVNSLRNQFIKGGLKTKVNNCNSKGQTDLSLGSATPPLLPLLVLIRGSRSTHHRGTCPSLSTAASLPTAAAGPSQVPSSRGTVKGSVHVHTMECRQPERTIKLHSFQKDGCNWRQSYKWSGPARENSRAACFLSSYPWSFAVNWTDLGNGRLNCRSISIRCEWLRNKAVILHQESRNMGGGTIKVCHMHM